MNDVGEQLRAAREARGLSIDDIAARLKIPARYVAALESGDTGVLPESTFVRGYVKAYAKAVSLDADALLGALAPVELKAPRPLIGPDGEAVTSRRAAAGARGPSFRAAAPRRHHWIMGGVLAVIVAGWVAWPTPEVSAPVTEAPPAAVPGASQVASAPPVAAGGVTLEVPLPGAAPAAAPVAAVVAPAPGTAAAVPPPAVAPTPAVVPPAAVPSAVAPPAAAVPRKGLYARFSGTCWVEVRDVDNVVIYTRIAMSGSDMTVEGKAPLTVTLGDAAVASLWFNGERVVPDRFSSNGIARIIVGQAAR